LVRRLTRVERVIVPSAGQNRRVPVFGALDSMTGEVTTLITQRKRSVEFLEFLRWLLDDIEADRDHLYLFLDNGSIRHTRAVEAFLVDNRPRLTVLGNATYAPDLKLIERFWGPLKRSAIHNYYFGTVENLAKAILDAVTRLHRNKNHPLRLPLKPVQSLPRAA
jgi:putative transposase